VINVVSTIEFVVGGTVTELNSKPLRSSIEDAIALIMVLLFNVLLTSTFISFCSFVIEFCQEMYMAVCSHYRLRILYNKEV
jgi:hypothetical protein